MTNAERALVELLNPALSSLGLKWIRARQQYVRQEPHGFSCFLWTSHSTRSEGGRLELTPVLGVRHDLVENVVNQLGLVYGEANQRYTTTVTRGLGYFPIREGKDYCQYIRLASVEKDLGKTVEGLSSVLATEGQEFFERYSTLVTCSVDLNNPIASKTHPLCNSFPRRAYYGIAAAWFAERQRVSMLIDQYRGFAKDVLPAQFPEVERTLAKLVAILEAG